MVAESFWKVSEVLSIFWRVFAGCSWVFAWIVVGGSVVFCLVFTSFALAFVFGFPIVG